MPSVRHFNPDHYLETEKGREYTPERSAAAFEQAYARLGDALSQANASARLFVVVGVQAAGKSTWIDKNAESLGADTYFFDAALPRRQHRERVLEIAKRSGVPVVAVWVRAPLAQALARNEARRMDHRVPEAALRNVYAMMEAPSTDEGFAEVLEVSSGENDS